MRNKRRSLTAIVGVVLAVTVIAGVNISVDTTANSTLMAFLDLVPVDFEISTNNESYEEIIDALKVEDVVGADVTTEVGFVTMGKWGYEDEEYATLIGVRPESKDSIVKMLNAYYQAFFMGFQEFQADPIFQDLTGDFNITSDGVVLQDYQAKAIDAEVGDTIYLENVAYWWNGTDEFNETFYYNVTVSGIIDFQLSEQYGLFDIGMAFPYAFVHIDDRNTLIEELNLTYYYGDVIILDDYGGGYGGGYYDGYYGGNYSFYVWTDRSELVLPGDLDKTKGNYAVMERTLRNSLLDMGLTDFSISESPIIPIMEGFNIFLMFARLVILAILIPIIVLGIYLSLISVEVGMTRRKRELGILKTRGATNRQLFGLLFTESIILGIIAGIIGLFLGIFVSGIFLSLTLAPSQFAGNLFGMYISNSSIAIVVIFSVAMIMIASYRPAKRITSQSGVEMLKHRAEGEVKVPYKPTLDIIFVGISVFTFALMFIVRSEVFGSLYQYICILDLVLIVLTPPSAFLFIIGLTRLLTRGTTKIYDKASRAVRFLTKDLWHIVNRNIVRNPRRTSNVCLIIALGLGFGMMVSTFVESQYTYEERLVKSGIGGDLSVDVTYDTNISFADNLSAVDGVDLLTPVVTLYTGTADTWVTLVAFNASTYYEIVEPEQYYFSEGDPKETIEKLKTKDNAIINTLFAQSEYLRVGDKYPTEIFYPSTGTTESQTFTVVGIAKILPGLSETYGIYVFSNQIYVDLDSLNLSAISSGDTSLKFLVKVSDGYDPSVVANEIKDLYPSSVVSVSVLKEELENIGKDVLTGTLYNFLMLIYFFAILIITFGLGLVIYFAAVERENELAGFMARGASTKQVSSLLFGEGLTIALVGVLIGVITGLLGAYMINELISFVISSSAGLGPLWGAEVVIERTFVISWLTLALILITIITLIIAGFIAALRVRRIKVAQALRERGG